MKPKFEADRLDWKIIELLQRDARMSNTEIGKTIGLSQPAVTSRIRALEDAGVIDGYTARINPRALGHEITAIIRLRTTHEKIAPCLAAFERIPEILEAHRITGEDCFVVKASFAHMPKLEATIDALAMYGSVTTSLVLATYAPKPLTAPTGSLA
ncbi:Lrp/AsnC family transcriptional regulator [Noviherbaspirillum saxi]|uniref:Lrp/AsnC family transcriptional regulator n=1 Tax=Noviherbaspirillum saxi TaxID=2320863 RepID=A0A3A3GEG3_9BURK|nr:Lrp/AsnC family transcriptional regulator [Noviherbaspirillum saxi]RJF99289.1 Lrp/AsnC family transcriptional regulator [Noviherbaspirillum saxi]